MSIQLMIEVERRMFLALKPQSVALFTSASQITQHFILDLHFLFIHFVTITQAAILMRFELKKKIKIITNI